MKRYDKDFPVVLGICGQAASGKTSVAQTLVPESLVQENRGIVQDHKFLAMPLYEMVAIKRKTQGEKSKDRQLYLMHSTLVDLFGNSPLYGAPSYGELVDLTETIVNLPIEMDEEKKPRTFLQTAGSLCRDVDPNCFVGWIHRAIIKDFLHAREADKSYLCVVSDIRMSNEAEYVAKHPNGVLVKFTVDPFIAKERQLARDGFTMTEEQAAHTSEKIDDIPADMIDEVIDSNYISVEEQTNLTTKALKKHLEGFVNAPLTALYQSEAN